MTKQVARTAKKIVAASGVAFGLAGLGMFVSAGIAGADNLQNVIDPDGTQGSFTDSVSGQWDRDGTQTDYDSDGLQADDVRDSATFVPQTMS
jgi:hypothetical protein